MKGDRDKPDILRSGEVIIQPSHIPISVTRLAKQLQGGEMSTNDPVNHPAHYTSDRFPFECIEITSAMDFCTGNMCKYIWRHLDKGKPLEDMEKARFYFLYELSHVERRFQVDSDDAVSKLSMLAGIGEPKVWDCQPFWNAMVMGNVHLMLHWVDAEIDRLKEEK